MIETEWQTETERRVTIESQNCLYCVLCEATSIINFHSCDGVHGKIFWHIYVNFLTHLCVCAHACCTCTHTPPCGWQSHCIRLEVLLLHISKVFRSYRSWCDSYPGSCAVHNLHCQYSSSGNWFMGTARTFILIFVTFILFKIQFFSIIIHKIKGRKRLKL